MSETMTRCDDCDLPLATDADDAHADGCECPRCVSVCWREWYGNVCQHHDLHVSKADLRATLARVTLERDEAMQERATAVAAVEAADRELAKRDAILTAWECGNRSDESTLRALCGVIWDARAALARHDSEGK